MPQESDSSAAQTRGARIQGLLSRSIAAYLLMVAFVLCTSVGAALIYLPAGFITLGLTSGIYAYLLGSD